MALYSLLLLVPLLGLFAFLILRPKNEKGYSWIQFYARGKDAGFAFKEIELLRKAAVKAEIEDPASLFWSEKKLDQCIRAMIAKARLTGEERNQETQDFLAKLYEYRKKIEFEHPKYKKGISSTKSIDELQPIRILLDGAGVFESQVLRNSDRFLTISMPSGSALPNKFSWKTRRIAVYFWRRNDAGYVFDTYVLDEAEARSVPVLHIAHSDSIFRTQKRKSIRTKVHKPAFLYLPQGEEPPEKIETQRGLKCLMEDVSETGCAVTIGGKAAAGLRVKVQFELDGHPIAMSGIVRSTEYNEETKRSLLHIEADPLSLATRNLILSEVFGVRPEDHFSNSFDLFGAPDPGAVKKPEADRSSAQGEPVLPMEESNE